jgi:hypothetical protein
MAVEEAYPPILVNATPDDVLAVFRDQCRHTPKIFRDLDPDLGLCRETTIKDVWWDAPNWLDPKSLAEALNAAWSVEIPLSEWYAVLKPAKAHTLGEVCDLLARYAKVPRVRPAKLMGRECLPAGVFLTIRHQLAAAGADVSEVAPSTPVAEYTRRYPAVFIEKVSQLAPGRLSAATIRAPVWMARLFALLPLWVAMIIADSFGFYPATVVLTLLWATVWFSLFFVGPRSLEFAGIRTFRDLSNAIAGGKTANRA